MAVSSIIADRIYGHPFLKEEVKKVPKLKAVGLDRMCITASVASTSLSLRFAREHKAKLQKDVRIDVLGAS